MNTMKILRLAICSLLVAVCPARKDLLGAVSHNFNPFVTEISSRCESNIHPSDSISSVAVALVSANERGTRLIISGIIYRSDGKTPLANAVLYAYQTDADGYYSREKGGNRNPRIRGRLRTGPDGRYEIRTIMPGHYPGSKIPSHIHASVTPAGGKEVEIDEFLFDGDPFLQKVDYGKFASQGRFSSIVKIETGKDGVVRGIRDIKVGTK